LRATCEIMLVLRFAAFVPAGLVQACLRSLPCHELPVPSTCCPCFRTGVTHVPGATGMRGLTAFLPEEFLLDPVGHWPICYDPQGLWSASIKGGWLDAYSSKPRVARSLPLRIGSWRRAEKQLPSREIGIHIAPNHNSTVSVHRLT
jgi:hypothetical protein